MPRFSYTATSFKGEKKSGVIEAKNEKELSQILHQDGYFLISVNLEEEKEKKRSLSFSLPFLKKVSLTEKMLFIRNLRVMVTAGIALPRALRTLSSQSKSKKFKSALSAIADEITRGKSFFESIALYPDIFSELFQNMIKVGEESGTLEEVLQVLARQMEREHELISKVKGALVYPAVIISAMFCIGILMLVVVVPKLSETFKELNITLPLTTRVVIAMGNFLSTKWYIVILFVLILIFLLRFFMKTKTGKRFFDLVLLKTPVISPIVKKTNSAYVIRALSSLFAAGVPIIRSLEIIGGAISNVYFKKTMVEAVEVVKKGGKLSTALSPYSDIYSSSVIQMIEVGEETGETVSILAKLADFFEEEVSNTTKNLTSIVEPILMLIIGATVGFFAVSMIQPMYSMLGAIK